MAAVLRVRNELFGSNTYLCPTSGAGQCILVDPGLDQASIDRALVTSGLRPVAIFCTHGHFDHVASAHEYQRRFDVPVHLHRDDLKTAERSNFLLMAFKIPARITLPRFELVDDGFSIRLGEDALHYLHAPGHTPGSCVVTFRGAAFTGDTVYRDGIGLVSLPGEDEALLRRSILALWSRLEDEAQVSPGHGSSSAFGELKAKNTALRNFLGIAG